MYILAQILGGLAILFWVYSISLNNKKDILLCQMMANVVYAIEYLILGALNASIMNISSLIRLGVYYDYEKKKKEVPKEVLLVFIIVILLIGIVTYSNLFSFVPIIITVLYAIALWQNNILITRIIYILTAFIWIFYNLEIGAFISIIGNILEIIVAFYSIMKPLKR